MENKARAGPSTVKVPPGSDLGTETDESKLRLFRAYSCPYCTKKFLCRHALGGHVNAHRDEKLQAKREKKARSNARKKPVSIAPSRPTAHASGNSSLVSYCMSWTMGGHGGAGPFWTDQERRFGLGIQQPMVLPRDSPQTGGLPNLKPLQTQQGPDLSLSPPRMDLDLGEMDLTLKL